MKLLGKGLFSMKYFIVILLLFQKTSYAETVNQVIFEKVKPSETINLLQKYKFNEYFSGRVIKGFTIGVAVPNNGNSHVVSLIVNGTKITQKIEEYEYEKPSDAKQFIFHINDLKYKDLKNILFKTESHVGIINFGIIYEDLLNTDHYNREVDRLEQLAKHRLYDDDARSSLHRMIRIQAIRDLEQYPIGRSMDIISEIIDYDPPSNTWDTDYQGFASLKVIIKKSNKLFGEFETAKHLNQIFKDYSNRVLNAIVVEAVHDFKSSAGLFFVIDNHTYSPHGDRSIYNRETLNLILEKEDIRKYVHIYKDQIIEELFGPYEDNGDWDQERACEVFGVVPVKGIINTIFPEIYEGYDSFRTHCSKAIINSLVTFDLSTEISDSLLNSSEQIILEEWNEPRWAFMSGYSRYDEEREIAVLILGESAEKHSILKDALKNPRLEENLRALIRDIIKND